MKRGTTVYLYELAWILPSFAIPVGMLAALVVTAFGAGVHLPGNEGRVDPRTVGQTGPFGEPGVVQIAPGQYEVRMTAQIWSFAPMHLGSSSTMCSAAVSPTRPKTRNRAIRQPVNLSLIHI